MNQYRWMCAALVIASLGAAPAVQAQERLILTSLVPPGVPHSAFYREWADRVNASSNGTLNIQVRDGATLANFGNVYERTLDDVVQIGWVQLPLVGGQFPLSSVTDLPFTSDGGENCSVAAWKLYESGLVDEEFADVVPLWFGCLGQNGMHFNQALESPTDLAGAKVRVNSALAGQSVESAGGTPISMTVENVYESLQRGTLDGAVTSWPAFAPQRVGEVTNYHLEVPVGSTISAFVMSRARYDALPEEAKAALTEHSGEAMSRSMGRFIDGLAANTRQSVSEDPEHTIVELSEAEAEVWRTSLESVREAWVADNPGGGEEVVNFYLQAHEDAAAASAE